MKSKSIHNGIKEIKKIGLSQNEKAAALSKLMQYVGEHPANHSTEHSPKKWRWQKLFDGQFSIYAVSLALLLLVIGGITYKAEGALPGEPLYAVKIGVNEPLRTSLAFTPAAQARDLVLKVDSRLMEAESLALESRLTPALATSLLNNVETSITRAGLVDQALAKEGDQNDVNDSTSDLQTTLNAHSHILSVVAQNSDQSDRTELSRLQFVLAPSTPPASAKKKQKSGSDAYDSRTRSAEDSISQAEGEINSALNSSNPVVQAIVGNATVLINSAKQALEDSKNRYDSGDNDQADQSLKASKQAAKEALISVRQSIKLVGDAPDKAGKQASHGHGKGDH